MRWEGDELHWYAGEAVVASAARSGGCWELRDADGESLVRLVATGDGGGESEMIALLAPKGRFLGSIRGRDNGGPGAAVACEPDGSVALVMRTDGHAGAHVVDRRGEIAAMVSWEDSPTQTDLLVTPIGTSYSLALVFGLLLTLELSHRTPAG
jgi:hypothetical protein